MACNNIAIDITPPHRCDKLECWILIFAGKEPTRVKPLTEPYSKGKFLDLLANARKGWNDCDYDKHSSLLLHGIDYGCKKFNVNARRPIK